MTTVLRRRLLRALESPLGLVVIDGVPGAGKRTLLEQWQRVSHGRRIVIDTRGLADVDEVVGAVRDGLASEPGDVGVGIHGSILLDAAEWQQVLAEVAGVASGPVVVAANDATEIKAAIRAQGRAFELLEETDLNFTATEVLELLTAHGIAVDDDVAHAIWQATSGHAGVTVAALRNQPEACALGEVNVEQALADFIQTPPGITEPGLVDVLQSLVLSPRMTAALATKLTGSADAPLHLQRLQRLQLGSHRFHGGLQDTVFHWVEPMREAVAGQIIIHPDKGRNRALERLVAAARETGDLELEVSALVAKGHLAEAEALLDNHLWDVLPDSHGPIWKPFVHLPLEEAKAFPGLLSMRAAVRREALAASDPAGLVDAVEACPGGQLAVLAKRKRDAD